MKNKAAAGTGSLLLALLLSTAAGLSAQLVPVYADTESGQVEGIRDQQVDKYLGIPYARPPVGPLRWKAPERPEPWTGTRPCRSYGPSAVQPPPVPFLYWPAPFLIPEEPMSEDCLSLNIWTAAGDTMAKPVLVFVHGGGFRGGGSACPIYEGSAFARQGIVFVSLNYRLGALGFLAHPALSAESPYGRSGNYGLLDLVSGLEWIRDNIARFGGDPRQVTIAGQSAGAAAVNYLVLSPLAKGLFHRAIAQSGSVMFDNGFRRLPSRREAEAQGERWAAELAAPTLSALREQDAATVIAHPGALATPYLDGVVVPPSPEETYRNQAHSDVPLLLGWNEEDHVSDQWLAAADFREQVRTRYGEAADTLLLYYPAADEAEAVRSQMDLHRDQLFGLGMYAWALHQVRHSRSAVYVYRFNRNIPAHGADDDFGASHTGEIPYVFRTLDAVDRPWTAQDRSLSAQMSAQWVQFVKTGEPNGPGLPPWPPFGPDDPAIMALDVPTGAAALPRQDRLRWLYRQGGGKS